jgi:molybdate transport repressor ModE-like protein
MLDVRRLAVLAAVARHGSVTAAAQALHYSQPSVSHHLARLEKEVGTPLLRKVGRGVRLTEAGRTLATRAEAILGRLADAEREIEEHATARRGVVRLAAFPTAVAGLVPAGAAGLAASHPGLTVTITEAEPPEALDLLHAGEVDLAVVFDYPAQRDGRVTYSHIDLFDDHLNLVLPAGHDATRLGQLRDEKWVTGCERCRAHLLWACARHDFVPEIVCATDDYVAVQALVAAGIGVTLLPDLALRAHTRPDLVVRRPPGIDPRRVRIAVHPEEPRPEAVRALIGQLRRAAGELALST